MTRWELPEITVDGFCGAGGASFGIRAALGKDPDIALNHSPDALAQHWLNFPGSHHLHQDVWKVDPRSACAGRSVGLLWASPACFPAGTMVLTRRGYVAIEQVEIGDEVLTHQRRWRPVTSVMSTSKPTFIIRGHGHPGICVSGEHPFYIRRRKQAWNNAIRRSEWSLDPVQWREASTLEKGDYWATPTEFPADDIPAVPGRGMSITEDFMWLVGRYIADGWTRLNDKRGELSIACGEHKVDSLRSRLEVWTRNGARSDCDELAWYSRPTPGAFQFSTSHRGLVEWLREHFGHGAKSKLIPGWALGMSHVMRRSLLEGYMSGDGHVGPGGRGGPLAEATTVSKALAFGIKALAESLGYTVAVYTATNRCVIEGRKVNAAPVWIVRWRVNPSESHKHTVRDSGFEWAPIRQREPGADLEVFNLSVEEDESYVVDGLVVHNCTHYSRAKAGKPLDRKIRELPWSIIRWIKTVSPRVVIVEEVTEFEDWGPLLEDDTPDPSRRGESFARWRRQFGRHDYKFESKRIVAADFGAPTTRERLFIIARRDGQPIVWPTPTHGPGRLPYRTMAECVDWSIPGRAVYSRLAPKTIARIDDGIALYVRGMHGPEHVHRTEDGRMLAAFIAQHNGGQIGKPLSVPLPTITTRDRHALVTVEIVENPDGEVRFEGRRYAMGEVRHRMLEPNELAAVMAFPGDLKLIGTKTARNKSLGNAVSPVVATALITSNYQQQGLRLAA